MASSTSTDAADSLKRRRDEVDESNILSEKRQRIQSAKVRENGDTMARSRNSRPSSIANSVTQASSPSAGSIVLDYNSDDSDAIYIGNTESEDSDSDLVSFFFFFCCIMILTIILGL